MTRASEVAPGAVAPDFTLPDQDGELVQLARRLETGPIVLYFYPKDETLGCTIEACAFRDSYAQFSAAEASVIGISDDSVARHRAFRQKHRIPFSLLSDEGGRVRTAYGVKKTLGLLPGRVTFVIDARGVVRHVYRSQANVRGHIEHALAALGKLRGSPSQL